MKKESLDQVRELIIEVLSKSDIDTIDKLELMVNINNFLKDYKENIKILSKTLKN